jgi:hypothetical protein
VSEHCFLCLGGEGAFGKHRFLEHVVHSVRDKGKIARIESVQKTQEAFFVKRGFGKIIIDIVELGLCGGGSYSLSRIAYQHGTFGKGRAWGKSVPDAFRYHSSVSHTEGKVRSE